MKKMKTYELAVCAVFAAVMCVLGPLTIPIGPVPVSLISFIIYLAAVVLGSRYAVLSCLVYLLLGFAGLPVLAGYTGGLAKLTGPTGGFLAGYLLTAWIGGIAAEKCRRNTLFTILGLIAGTVVLYLFGTVWFICLMHCDFFYALGICVLPFVLIDLIKIIIAVIGGKFIRRALAKNSLELN